MITVKETNYSVFGKCAVISNGKTEVYVTLDIGPRIIRYAVCGKENMMWENTELNATANGSDFDALFYEGAEWKIYGGHRMWLSPESKPRSYYPDNEPVDYEILENGIITKPKKQIGNQVRYEITVTMSESGEVTVKHVVYNENAFDIECAIWGLSVTDQNGLLALPVTQRDTGLLSNRTMSLWPYTKMNDQRVYWGEKFITLQQDPNATCAFKIGLSNEDAFALLYNHDCLMVKKFDYNPNATYPDGGACFEAYTSNLFLESESLGALVKLAPGECTEHNEYWTLFDNVKRPANNDEAAFAADVEKYV